MRRALAYGATKEAWFEAIKAAAVPGGGVDAAAGGAREVVADLYWTLQRPLRLPGLAWTPSSWRACPADAELSCREAGAGARPALLIG